MRADTVILALKLLFIFLCLMAALAVDSIWPLFPAFLLFVFPNRR